MNRQAGHGILFEPHRRNEEAVDDIVSPKNYLDLTLTGTTITPLTTSSLEAGSFVSRPSAASPPAEASSSSGFVSPNFPSGPG